LCARCHRTGDENSRQMASITARRLGDYIAILRPTNLLIVAITQYILYYTTIADLGKERQIDHVLFFLFVLDTILISASGYLINDIIDVDIDKKNKPLKSFIPTRISISSAKVYYVTLVVIGFLLALYIAIRVKNLPFLIIYPAAVGFLLVYSLYLKGTVLLGNILVSLYIALVPGILLAYDIQWLNHPDNQNEKELILILFISNMILSFLTNLSREIIKDIEDIDGDRLAGLKTLPIKFGVENSKKVSIALMTVSMAALTYYFILTIGLSSLTIKAVFITLIIFNIYIIYKIMYAPSEKKAYSLISTLHKVFMVMGLCGFIFVSKCILK
jgi:4-hydroxybenzoate polyprenyltransferase